MGDSRSNFGTIAPLLFTRAPIPVGNIHPMPVEVRPPGRAAAVAAEELREIFGTPDGAIPRFDLLLLGMGGDYYDYFMRPGNAPDTASCWYMAVGDVTGHGIQAALLMRGCDFPSVLAERFIKFLGPYPVGSFVRLTNGEFGFVRDSNPIRPLLPVVLVVCDAARRPLSPPLCRDLSNDAEIRVDEALDAAKYGLDPQDYLLPKQHGLA